MAIRLAINSWLSRFMGEQICFGQQNLFWRSGLHLANNNWISFLVFLMIGSYHFPFKFIFIFLFIFIIILLLFLYYYSFSVLCSFGPILDCAFIHQALIGLAIVQTFNPYPSPLALPHCHKPTFISLNTNTNLKSSLN